MQQGTAEDFPLRRCVCKCHFQPASLVICILIPSIPLGFLSCFCVSESVITCGLFPSGRGFRPGCSLQCQLFFWKFKTPSHVFFCRQERRSSFFGFAHHRCETFCQRKSNKRPASSLGLPSTLRSNSRRNKRSEAERSLYKNAHTHTALVS